MCIRDRYERDEDLPVAQEASLTSFVESEVEEAALAWLGALGWEVAPGVDFLPDTGTGWRLSGGRGGGRVWRPFPAPGKGGKRKRKNELRSAASLVSRFLY